jgi:DNA polymerase delta subunit 1
MRLGHEAATLLNTSFPPPISLEFEKVYCPYLLFAKKHYAGLMYTDNAHKPEKMDIKGLQRRDKCKFVEETFHACLDRLLHSDLRKCSMAPHVEFVRSQVDKLLSGSVPVDDLVLTTQLSKDPGDYVRSKLPDHVELAGRMAQRGAGYKMGSRILYVRIASLEMRSSIEDPVVALQQGHELDFRWYLEHQLKEPLRQLFALVLPQATSVLFGQGSAPPKPVVKRLTSTNPIMQGFLAPKRQPRCLHCDIVLPDRPIAHPSEPNPPERLCSQCGEEAEDLVMAAQSRLIEADLAAKATLKTCLTCTGEVEESHQMADKCANVSCHNIFARARAKIEVDTADAAFSRLERCLGM